MNSLHIAVHEKTGRLVEGYPVCYSVGQSLDDCFYIESKVVYNIFFQPAALFILPERQIPVVERNERLDSVFNELINEIAVKFKSLGVDLAVLGDNSRPGCGEPV